MTGRCASFARHNAIALVALFIALGGTTYAATALPKNSVGTKQVINGSLQKLDLSRKAQRALKGNRGPRGFTGARGATGAQGAQGVKGDTGAKGDSATTDGTSASLVRSSGAVAATQTVPGFINVTFNQNVDTCAYVATTVLDNFTLPPRRGVTVDRNPSEPNKVYVQTFDTSGSSAVADYFLAVFC